MLLISLLGEQAIIDDATGRVRTRSSRSVALVAYLVAHAGTPQTRPRIAALFWPDSSDAQALTNLRRELHHLRHVLADDPSLTITSTDLCWRDAATCRVDVRTFQTERERALAGSGDEDLLRHGQAAITEYGGDLLPGSYDDWVLDLRENLQRECVGLCDLVGAAGRRRGEWATAIDAARLRIRFQPLEEAGYRTLMELQSESGDRAGAISTYHHCASVLERELGVDPDPATARVLDRLIGSTEPNSAGVLREVTGGRSGVAAVALVGRRAELERLGTVFQDATQRRLGVALVSGDAGVGKSRLVAELTALAQREGAVVASAQCFGASGRLALAPVAEWLRHPAFRSASQTLEPVWQTEVNRLVPSPEGRDVDAEARAMVDAWQRHRFFEGLARALLAVRRPTLLVLENLQWCDEETLKFLAFLLGLAPDAQLTVAITGRRDEIEQSRAYVDWLGGMRGSGHLVEVPLSPLDVHETARLAGLLSTGMISDEDAVLLHAATGGFALYVVEAARSVSHLAGSPMPPVGDLSAVLHNRLDQTSPSAKVVAGLAAAVGQDFDLALLSEASDLDEDTVVRAVDELWRRRIVREFKDGYDFSHDLLRDAAYHEVSPPQRWLLHRRLAQGLELLHAGHTDEVAPQLADQYARGGNPERALAYYRRAAEVAASVFAHAEAIKHQRSALTLLQSLPRSSHRDSHELGIREAMAAPLNALHGYSSPAVQEALERAVELAERLGRQETLVKVLVGLWASRFVQGRTSEAHDLATQVLSLAEPESRLSGQAHFTFAGSAQLLGMPELAAQHFEIVCERSSEAESLSIGSRPAIHARAWSAHAYWLLGQHERAAHCCAQAVDRARAAEHPYSLTIALAYAGITYHLLDESDALNRSVDELAVLSKRYGFVYYRDWGLVLQGWAHGGPDGISLAHKGISNLKALGAFARMPYWLALLADVSPKPAALATLDAALVAAEARDDRWWTPEVMRMRAAHDGDADAVSRLTRALELSSRQGSVPLAERCRRDLRARGVRPAEVDALTAPTTGER